MSKSEQDLLDAVAIAEDDVKIAKDAVTHIKKELIQAESRLLGATLQRNNLIEQLRVCRVTAPTLAPVDAETSGFRERNPDACEVWGVWNATNRGWCFVEACFRTFKPQAEQELLEYQKEFPDIKYEVRAHAPSCHRRGLISCCVPEEKS
jgi:hypothetical protein